MKSWKGGSMGMREYVYVIATLTLLLVPLQYSAFAQDEVNAGRMDIILKSSAFMQNALIPDVYTCKGMNISPPLEWSNIPKGTKTISLICDDPDAPIGTWVHWVVYNIPGEVRGLPEGIPQKELLENGTIQGKNDFRKTGYKGPCPPFGIHRYYFKIYALDIRLDLKPNATKKELLNAMDGHILASGQLIGKYKK